MSHTLRMEKRTRFGKPCSREVGVVRHAGSSLVYKLGEVPLSTQSVSTPSSHSFIINMQFFKASSYSSVCSVAYVVSQTGRSCSQSFKIVFLDLFVNFFFFLRTIKTIENPIINNTGSETM